MRYNMKTKGQQLLCNPFNVFCLIVALLSCHTVHKDMPTQEKNTQTSSGIQSPDSILSADAKLQLISDQFSFTEGAAVDKEGNVFFTDQPNNKIWKYSTDGKLSVFLDKAGRSNGMYFDNNDNLVSCADEHNQVWRITKEGVASVLVTDFQGHRLNGPNDLWIDAKGGIYLSDPYYQRDYWERTHPDAALGGQHLYYLHPDHSTLTIADSNLVQPNGLVGTPDGKQLYVGDIGASLIYKYEINEDGSLSNRQVFIKQSADGITLDDRGNVYCAGNGVTVFNKEGKQINHIDVPEKWTANLCFGGKDKNILFITASKSFYMIPTLVKGVE
jgi:gluconolactonase